MSTMTFGHALEIRRAVLRLSRRDLVALSGVSYPYLSQIETETRNPNLSVMHRLAEALGMESAFALVAWAEKVATVSVGASEDS